MVCIYCSGDLAVTNSRPQKSRNQVWRRRLCKACGAVFTAVEAIDLSQALTVSRTPQKGSQPGSHLPKRLERLEPFVRDRLFISIYESLRHRPTAASDARGLADTVIAHIIVEAKSGVLPLRTIIQTTLNTLQRFDSVAASHYGAFHKLT